MAESTVKIKLVTTADTSGAQQINAALGITSERERELISIRSQFMSAAEAEVAQVKKLAEESMKLAKVREAEAEAAKRRPLLAEGIERERAEVEKLINAQKQLTAERNKPAAAANPWASGGHSFNSRSPVFLQQLIDLDKVQERAANSTRNMGYAMMNTGRIVQDFEAAGWMGVTNNIEGFVQTLGGPAGLAGVLTIVAVGLQVAGPQIAKFFASFDGAKQVEENLKALQQQLGLIDSSKDRAAIAGDRFTKQLAAEDAALKAQMQVIKGNVALFNLRNAAAVGAAEFEAQEKIEDIKAQSLPKEQESAAIAQVKLGLLQRQASLQQEASDNAIVAAQQEAGLAGKAAADAEKEAARLEEIISRTARLMELQQEGARLEKQLSGLQSQVSIMDGVEYASEQLRSQIRAAESAVGANKSAQAEASMGGLADASTPEIAKRAREDATAKAAAAAAASAGVDALARTEAQKAANEARRREQERQRIAREAMPGVYDARNLVGEMPPDPLTGARPLPGASGAGLPRPIMEMPADPLTGARPLPGAGRFNAPPPNPLGGVEPLPQLEKTADAARAAADSNDRGNAATVKHAEATTAELMRLRKANEDLERKMNELTTKVKDSRS